jgi:hypothetical protein
MATTPVNVYPNQGLMPLYAPHLARQHHMAVGVSLTVAKGTVMGIKTADGKLYPYASANVDGTQNPSNISTYDIVTDGSGNVTIGGGDYGAVRKTAPMYYQGIFNLADLVGCDANAITKLGRQAAGTAASAGVLVMT